MPEFERISSEGGMDVDVVMIEQRSASCGGGICIANHFQGRVSCPYGTNPDELRQFVELYENAPSAALEFARQPDPDTGRLPGLCLVHGGDPDDVEDYVREQVAPQLKSRPPEVSVHCSCRCANGEGRTDDGANYCECGPGLSCQALVEDTGLGDPQFAGSYCVRSDGREYSETGPTCDRSLQNCSVP